jgi:hypothetical protein
MNKMSCFTLDISCNALFAITMETGDKRGWRGRGTSNPMPTAASWDAMDAVITSCEVS